MKVAITGATGFLGRYLVSYLLDNLYDVLIITRGEERAKEYLPAGVNVYVTDYSFESLCEGLKEVETIIHLAAQTMPVFCRKYHDDRKSFTCGQTGRCSESVSDVFQ